MAPPPLVDELVEEILLRIPPDDPARLARAALVCKRWCRLVTDPGFRRRFREFHRAPPMLGLRYRRACATRFRPTSSFRTPDADCRNWRAVDARHGRILFYDPIWIQGLIVSDPITSEMRRLPMPRFWHTYCTWSAALLCGAAGCDHLDCPCGPFIVILLGTGVCQRFTSACLYSSEGSTWSKTASVEHPLDRVREGRPALVGNALYFLSELGNRILEYDLGKQELSVINLPSVCRKYRAVLMTGRGRSVGVRHHAGFQSPHVIEGVRPERMDTIQSHGAQEFAPSLCPLNLTLCDCFR